MSCVRRSRCYLTEASPNTKSDSVGHNFLTHTERSSILHSNFILASNSAGELQQEALSPMDPITGLPRPHFPMEGCLLTVFTLSVYQERRCRELISKS